jgi:hypothetical protein
MLKTALLAAILGMTFIAPAFADDYVCDEATLTKMKTKVDAMTDKDKQSKSVTEWQAAMDDMKAKNLDSCKAHMKNLEESSG